MYKKKSAINYICKENIEHKTNIRNFGCRYPNNEINVVSKIILTLYFFISNSSNKYRFQLVKSGK